MALNRRCWSCDYDLRAASARCPECGRPFDPEDFRTTNPRGPLSRMARRALGPIPWVAILLAVIGAVMAGVTFSAPADEWRFSLVDLRFYARPWEWRTRQPGPTTLDALYTMGLYATALGMLFGVLRLLGRGVVMMRHRAPRSLRRRMWPGFVVLMVCAAVTVMSAGYGWNYRLARRWAAEAEHARKLAGPAVTTNLPPGLIRQPSLNLSQVRTTVSVPDGGTLTFGGGAIVIPASIVQEDATPAVEEMKGEDLTKLARTLALRGQTPGLRTWGLKFLIERDPESARGFLSILYAAESDVKMRAMLLRLMAIAQRPEDAPRVLAALGDVSAEIRAAAADGVGLFRRFAPAQGAGGGGPWRVDTDPLFLGTDLATDPPIGNVFALAGAISAESPIPASARQTLEKMMTEGPTPEERQAAARVLVAWPPKKYTLRVAEWAVMFADQNDQLQAAATIKEQLATIPGFVHRVGNADSEFASRLYVQRLITTWKPVAHFSVDRPLAVRFEVGFRGGRPWLAFPRPDDLTIADGSTHASDAATEMDTNDWADRDLPATERVPKTDTIAGRFNPPPAEFPPMLALREGYPWLSPEHKPVEAAHPWNRTGAAPRMRDRYTRGLVWQSLVISPTKLRWMIPPAVRPGGHLDWWNTLRNVRAAWVSSREDAERFLYFDGPVGARPPVMYAMAADRPSLIATSRIGPCRGDAFYVDAATSSVRGVALSIGAAGEKLGAGRSSSDSAPAEINLRNRAFASGEDVANELSRLLCSRGLHEDEAAGLLAAWREVFFKPGRRVLHFLTEAHYDHLFPHVIMPAPTTFVRVGIVIHELDRPAGK